MNILAQINNGANLMIHDPRKGHMTYSSNKEGAREFQIGTPTPNGVTKK